MRKKIYAQVTVNDDYEPTFSQVTPDKTPGKGPQIVMIMSTHRVVIRVAELTKADKRLTPAIQWRLVQENFPIGPLLNGDTHIFDGSIFTNNAKQQCFMMAAIPKEISETIANEAIEKWSNPHRLKQLDTIEHVLFRHYTKPDDTNAKCIVFPQSIGYRALCINSGLPKSAYSISNHPKMREAELERILDAAESTHVIILDDGTKDRDNKWLKKHIQSRGEIEIIDDTLHDMPYYAHHW